MTIEQLGDKKVLISLCSQDMKDYSLSFDTMSLDDDHARKVIMRLLRLACNKTGIPYPAHSAIVEALPYESGCMILATLMDRVKKRRVYKVKRITECPGFTFSDSNNMMDALCKLSYFEYSLPQNSLWLYEDKYRLVFEYPIIPDRVHKVLSEYGIPKSLSKVQISRIKECGRLICGHSAVGTIGSKLRNYDNSI